MCNFGKLKLNVELNKVGFFSGEDMFISVVIENKCLLIVIAV